MFIDHGYLNGQVEQRATNAIVGLPALNVSTACYSLFVDNNGSLYCSLSDFHMVVKKSLSASTLTPSRVAGINGTAGSTPNRLYDPCGIFVDDNLNLYVADTSNDRIQFFLCGQFHGSTVAGSGAPGTIALLSPNGVTLDGNGHLFITDSDHHRIVWSSPDGYRCLVGCKGVPGAAADELSTPWSISFDTRGNMYVNDRDNLRIQKFSLATNSCGRCFFIHFDLLPKDV